MAKVERKGKFYCTIHDPVRREARKALRDEKWQEKYAKEAEKFKREMIAERLLGKYSTAELKAAKGVELIR